ncbi:MAG: T9SS type A sorting domain-containing protein, partial [Bacteroidia bacterium]
GADINGKISMQRYMSSASTGWRFLGSPVRTTLQDWSNDFVTSGFPGSAYPGFNFCSVYSYDETVMGTSDYGYEIPNGVSDSLLPGIGYWCWIGPTPMTVEVTGKPGKFAQSFNVSLTPSAGKYEDGWNMLANPYPSAIDWDAQSWNKVGIQDAVYIWDPVSEQYSTYINGIGVNGGSNIIPSSRAFWVQANQNNPVLSCDESVKIDASPVFLRPANQPQIRLQLNGNSYADETVIFFSNNSSANVNADEDAMKLYSDNPLVPSINSVADSTDLAVNSLPANTALVVPVKVKVGASGSYTLVMNQGYNQSLNSCIFLEDLLTGTKLNLHNAINYVFMINDTTSAPRFLLHITKPVDKASVNTTCSYKQNGMALVSVNDGGIWGYTWKDALGNILAQHPAGPASDTLKNLAPGTYNLVVKGPTTYCPQLTEQVIVGAPEVLSSNVNVSNNNCPKETNGSLSVTLVEGGTGPYHYNWSNGMHGMNIQGLVSGVYTLIITDVQGCLDTSYHAVTNKSKLKAAFTIVNDTASIYVNQLVVFTEQCIDANNWLWNFGDAVSSSQNTVRMFSTAGTHTIQLTGSDGTCSATETKIINVKSLPVPNYPTANGGILVYNAGDDAQVKFDLEENCSAIVMVYTADGKLISKQNFSAWKNNETVKLGESHGIYVIRVKTNGTEICQKLIK